MPDRRLGIVPLVLAPLACTSTDGNPRPAPPAPIRGAVEADHLIQPGEVHLAHLWQVTFGGENAEAYWSFDGKRLVMQRRAPDEGVDCDRIYVTGEGGLVQVSDGRGVTTCPYFLPGDREVVFASTQAEASDCPPPLDFSKGYVWAIWPEFDVWIRDLRTDGLRRLTDVWGYDAEATVSPVGDRMVFTSTRSGDLELWTCDLDGSNLFQVTDTIGYDGGAFFSHDGTKLVFRTTAFTGGEEEQERYRALLGEWRIRPHSLEIMVIDADGTNRRQVTRLGGASWAPYFFPDDGRILFSSNHHDPDPSDGMNFDLFAIDEDGGDLERITTYDGFDSFPIFSPDGRYLAFSSNRGGSRPGETNVFVARWR